MILEEFSAVLDKARQQRADTIGAGIRKHPVVAVLVGAVFVIVIPVMLMQVQLSPSEPVASNVQDVSSFQASLVHATKPHR
jgi:hypothetical protein